MKLRPFTVIAVMTLTATGSVLAGPSTTTSTTPKPEEEGCFWHLTDIHLDNDYKVNKDHIRQNSTFFSDDKYDYNTCWKLGGGKFGDYNCDSSMELVKSALKFINDKSKTLTCKPFMLWTGDDNSHADNWHFDLLNVTSNIEYLTGMIQDMIQKENPDLSVFPVFGNHDIDPKSQFPGNSNQTNFDHYKTVGMFWTEQWLKYYGIDNDQFQKGGYYAVKNDKFPFKLIGLNTNVYYASNKLTTDLDDPLGQFAWLEKELNQTMTEGGKALVFAHVTPGMFERYYGTRLDGTMKGKGWFTGKFNQKYLTLIEKYSDVIVGQFYGHQHSDAMKVTGKNFALLAPAVTPWRTTLSPEGGSNNPGVRLVKYSKNDGKILDYTQFYLDLYQANLNGTANWETCYSFKNYYYGDPPSAEAITKITEGMSNDDWFGKYYLVNTVKYEEFTEENCDDKCKAYHYCAILKQGYEDFDLCVNERLPQNDATKTKAAWPLTIAMYFAISRLFV